MRDTRPLLDQVPFPAIRRGRLDTLQVNVGYRCNQSCFHCHVNAGPNRTEEMSAEVADLVLDFVERRRIATLDITGGAPELNANFRRMVTRRTQTRRQGDGPLQPHHSGTAGAGRPRRIPGSEPRRGGRLDAVLSAGQRGTPARQGRVRRLDPRPEEAQRARLRARSGAYAQPGLQSARAGAAAAAGRARSRLQARARRATTASCSTNCSCSPICRSSASAPC